MAGMDLKTKKKRLDVVTSTEMSALFGANPYVTEYELFHRKRDRTIVEIEPTERMKWGTRLEPAIAKGIAEDKGWRIRRLQFKALPELRIGSSFDYEVDEDLDGDPWQAIMECKNVDQWAYKEGWIVEDDHVEAPPHIEFQVQVELMVSGKSRAYIAALIGGNRTVILKREPMPEVQKAIREKVAAFWKRVDENDLPAIDFERDAAFISKLYAKASEGKVYDASSSEEFIAAVGDYRDAAEIEKAAGDRKKAAKAKMLTIMQDAEKATGANFTVSASIIEGATVPSYQREPYRNFKVNFKKEK